MKKAFETVTAYVEDVSALLRGLVMLGIVVGILFDDYFGVVAAIGELMGKFGDAGSAQVGDVIRFTKAGTYFGDAVINTIASNTSLTIGSTAGLSGAAISASGFTITQLPKYTITDSSFRETFASPIIDCAICLLASNLATLIDTNEKFGFSKLDHDPVVKSPNLVPIAIAKSVFFAKLFAAFPPKPPIGPKK